ncbi:MAG: type IX secretion system outer membrane channel protein PorV [Bacteroidales bacterium]|nr:type IX secretion system outer membrane channel protein PorV [Bacteroidales bacterium]
MKRTLLAALLLLLAHAAFAQSYTGQSKNYISTGMPILLIAPDAVASAMGDAGVASTPDAYSAHWNNAKYAFINNKGGISTTYTPWLRNLGLSDMNLLYLAGYYGINNRSTLAASLTYFSLGDIQHTDEEGTDQGTFMPNEFAFDVTYAMKLSDNLSLGASGRYIRDDLTNGQDVERQTTKAANSLAADVGLYYQKDIDQKQTMAAGVNISNLGSKLSYSDDDTQNEFLPANLRFGGRYTYNADDFNKISVLLDFNKLLVPTPPQLNEETGEYEGKYENMADYRSTGSIQGVFNSFMDAPGGFKEEFSEIALSVGAEYWYANTFAARAGYFYEHENKGGRKYITLGIGMKYNIFVFDLAYLIPTSDFSNNPLANTIRISLALNFAKSK